jgi:hypothetical protein
MCLMLDEFSGLRSSSLLFFVSLTCIYSLSEEEFSRCNLVIHGLQFWMSTHESWHHPVEF